MGIHSHCVYCLGPGINFGQDRFSQEIKSAFDKDSNAPEQHADRSKSKNHFNSHHELPPALIGPGRARPKPAFITIVI